MSVKQFRARVQHKKKTEAEWYLDVYVSAGSTELREDPFIPLDGELVIFEKDGTHENDRFKFGDGKTNVMDLPFSSQAQVDWNQNDETTADFIKNRTHYEVQNAIIFKGRSELAGNSVKLNFKLLPNTEYQYYADYNNGQGGGVYEDTITTDINGEVSFEYAVHDIGFSIKDNILTWTSTEPSSTGYYVKISGPAIKQLDPKYIPSVSELGGVALNGEEASQTAYITDPQGNQSYKRYTSEAEPSTIVHREASLNTFAIADPMFNGHPVTVRYAKNRYFPMQTTSQTKVSITIDYTDMEDEPLSYAKIDELFAEKCEAGQKLYCQEIRDKYGINNESVVTIVLNKDGKKIVNPYTSIGLAETAKIYNRSPFLYEYNNGSYSYIFRIPDGTWYCTDDIDHLDENGIPVLAVPFKFKEIAIHLYDLSDPYEHATSAVMIQDPKGNPSYKNYTTGVADQANYIDYNINLRDVDKYNRIEREKVGGQIVSFNSQGFFNVPNPENVCHPVNLGYAQANFLRLKTKKENGEIANVYTDSIPYIKVQDQDYGISLNNAIFEPLKLTYGPSNASDMSQSGRALRFYSNGRFNVLDPTSSLHPVNKRTLDNALNTLNNKIADLSGAMHYIGTTTTVIYEGSTTQSITLNDTPYLAQAGDVATYNDSDYGLIEYVWNGRQWIELGQASNFVSKSAYDAKMLELTNTNTALESRIKALEDAIAAIGTLTITESGSTLVVQ